MSHETLQWLRQQVKALPAVRNAHLSPDTDASLIIRTWVGMSVKVYFLDGVPNLRAVKRVLQENTRTLNQATLFVVHHALMPPDKKRVVLDEWMHALHELNSERIYTYIPGECQLRQVHFDHMPDGVEREVWHGDPVVFEKLRVLNASPNTRAIRGDWKVADFGANPYWRTSKTRTERLRTRFRRAGGTYTHTHYDVGGMPGGATHQSLHRAHMSELDRSLHLLGVTAQATEDEVKKAFRRLARQFHPDVSKLDKTEAENRFREINVAYEYIKSQKRWTS